MKQLIQLKVNGELHEVAIHPHRTLLEVLREELELTGARNHYGPVSVVVGAPAIALAVKRNPTDGELVLRLHVPRQGHVVLELHDVDGRLVRRKDVGSLSSGTHGVRWKFQHPVPPGHYTVRVRAAGQQAAAKVVLTR